MFFKKNDKVICNTSYPGFPQKGWKGKVIVVEEQNKGLPSFIGVEWENPFTFGHSCELKGKYCQCRYYYYDLNRSNDTISILSLDNRQLELF